jgi:hypothetical protein
LFFFFCGRGDVRFQYPTSIRPGMQLYLEDELPAVIVEVDYCCKGYSTL